MSNKIKPVSFSNLEAYTNYLKSKYAKKADIPTQVSVLTNDAKYQTEEQVTAAINAKVSTTTDSFMEGAGQKHPAGTNVAVVEAGEGYKYDVLAGFVDLSGYVKAEDVEEITAEEIAALFEE